LPALFAKITEIDAVGMGCLTNAARGYADAVVLTHGLGEIFEVVHGADDVPRAKPHPDGLELCANEMAVDVGRCVYIGEISRGCLTAPSESGHGPPSCSSRCEASKIIFPNFYDFFCAIFFGRAPHAPSKHRHSEATDVAGVAGAIYAGLGPWAWILGLSS
jgi:hypothetical protein